MSRVEVLRGPQGTLFGRNSTGGVINMITNVPDLDAFAGSANIQYGADNEKMVKLMLNVPISNTLGARFALSNFERDGVNKNLNSAASEGFDNRDSYMWRASFRWEAADDITLDFMHQAYDEESARTQRQGSFCEVGGNAVQGCVIGGTQTFHTVHPMSTGSTVPLALGKTLAGFYVPDPNNIGANGAAGSGQIYVPEGTPAAFIDTGKNRPSDYFQSNVIRSPLHDAQESTSQIRLEKLFDQGSLTVSYLDNRRQFYRDTISAPTETTNLRFSTSALAQPQAGVTESGAKGLPIGYSNRVIRPQCDMFTMKDASFCPPENGVLPGIAGFFEHPVSGDASQSDARSKSVEIKYQSDLDGMFNFLVGAIDISNSSSSFYDVYATGITMNGVDTPTALISGTRVNMYTLIACTESINLGAGLVSNATLLPASVCTPANMKTANALVGAGQATLDAGPFNPYAGNANVTAQDVARDIVSRIDGLYSEHFQSLTDTYALDASALFTEFYFDVNDQHKITLGLRYTEDTKSVKVNNYFYKVPLVSAWNPLNKTNCDIQSDGSSGAVSSKATALNEFTTTLNTAQCFTGGVTGDHANTVGQRLGVNPGTAVPNMANGSIALNPLPALNADYTNAGIPPVKSFSKTTGRFVWDYQIDDDTLFYASYSTGFKGGGFNPPFDSSRFPNTPFTFDPMDVTAIEFGVKATVPEIGLVANASIYYNDFENYHVSVIRNETGINEGMDVENYGAELELLLRPPTVPGLSFNFMMSYITSEIGNKAIINPADLGGHYAGTAASKEWHAAKGQQANTYLIKRDELGVTSMKAMDMLVSRGTKTGNDILTADMGQARLGNELAIAVNCSTSTGAELAPDAGAANTDTLGNGYAWAGGCSYQNEYGKKGLKLEFTDITNIIVPIEFSKHAEAYGTKGLVCHMLSNAAAGLPQTCIGGFPNSTAGAPASGTLLYSPVNSALGTHSTSGSLLPSIIVRGNGSTLQSGGICKLFTAMHDHADSAGTTGAGLVQYGTNADGSNEVCVTTLTEAGSFVSTGLPTDITGNEMPFPELTVSMGIGYTAQAGNLEITPRLDYYYQSDYYNGFYNIESRKSPAWDEWNFSLRIVPTDADWNIRFYVQNLTDERNITGMGLSASSQGFFSAISLREPRSWGMSFGIDF
jgi:outer membrane receptor protein involved in Fe transport